MLRPSVLMTVEQHCRFVEQMLDQHLPQFRALPESAPGHGLVLRARAYVKGVREAAASGDAEAVLVLLEVLEWLMLQIFEVLATA